MAELRLFEGIGPDSVREMLGCFKAEQRSFRRGETVMMYSSELAYLCVLISGRAHLYCMDSDGDYAVLEQYVPDDIFGEVFAMPYGDLGYAVEADSDCRVMFIRFSAIYGRCPRACEHHTLLTRNLFQLSAKKAQDLAVRINMISKRSLRRKLTAYLEYMRDVSGGDCFRLELSLSRLAAYLCADRASMTRELKSMCDQGLIAREGKSIRILNLK